MKKHGFTLAETLITLTIIGVVAAMTIPTLMGKYQERALESQFKKSYSILNQAVAISGQNYECHFDIYYTWSGSALKKSQCKEFWEDVLNQLKYTKSESVTVDSWSYKTTDEIESAGGTCLNLKSGPSLRDLYTNKYYLVDGSLLFTSKERGANWYSPLVVSLDVNGEKGPNKYGYDMFFLQIIKQPNGGVMLYDYIASAFEKGGKRPRNILTGAKDVSDKIWSFK